MAIRIDPKKERTENEKRRFEEILQNSTEEGRAYAELIWKMGVPIEHIEGACKKEPREEEPQNGRMSKEEVRRRMNRNAIAFLAFDPEDF